jgi:hypothetical protein
LGSRAPLARFGKSLHSADGTFKIILVLVSHGMYPQQVIGQFGFHSAIQDKI